LTSIPNLLRVIVQQARRNFFFVRGYLSHHVGTMYADFSWSTAPLSHWTVPLIMAVIYNVIVFNLSSRIDSGAAVISPATTKTLYKLQQGHNLVLSLGSLVMMLGTIFELYRRSMASNGDNWWFVCEDMATQSKGPLFFWAYIYYLSKFYELFDTLLQMIKGRRPPSYFLHVYHHSVVMYMSWGWLEYSMSLMWAGLLFNTLVHTIMYYYYFLKSRGVSPWWKRHVTTIQVLQFSVSVFLGALLCHDVIWKGAQCSGLSFVCFNLVFNLTLLFQFASLLIGKSGQNKIGSKRSS